MARPNLLLLHGAVGASSQFAPLAPYLEERFQIHRLDFEGHGHSPPRDRPFRIEHFAENVVDYLASESIERIDIFGYSMGGYVALYVAKTHPGRVRRIATLGTKLRWDPEVAAREVQLLDPKKIAEKVPQFARTLQERHIASGWEDVLHRTAEMLTRLGERPVLRAEDFGAIGHRVRIGIGDRDNMVSVEESLAIYRTLPQGELEVFPGAPHPFEQVPHSRLARSLTEFFE